MKYLIPSPDASGRSALPTAFPMRTRRVAIKVLGTRNESAPPALNRIAPTTTTFIVIACRGKTSIIDSG